MKKSLYATIRELAVVSYWKRYQRRHAGWRSDYARHILSYSANEKTWYRDLKELRSYVEQNYPGPLAKVRFHYWKLKYWFYKSFYGSVVKQDFVGQMRLPFRQNRHIVTNGRTTFVSRRLNSREAIELCLDKTQFASHWAQWFRRRWRRISAASPLTAADLSDLLNETSRIVVKPLDQYGGRNVQVIDVEPSPEGRQRFLSWVNQLGGCHIVEEYIDQTGRLRQLNPSSVNSVRVVTMRHLDGRIELLNAYVRSGREGSLVDNLTAGGRAWVVDLRNGEFREAEDAHGHYRFFPPHDTRKREGNRPDAYGSGMDTRIPGWDKVVSFCISAHEHAPEGLRYAGWDVCVSEEGLYMLEGNGTPGLHFAYSPKEEADPWEQIQKLLDEDEAEQKRSGACP